jgi:hypothetical protein
MVIAHSLSRHYHRVAADIFSTYCTIDDGAPDVLSTD